MKAYNMYKRVVVWEHYFCIANNTEEALEKFNDGDSDYEGFVEDDFAYFDYDENGKISLDEIPGAITEVVDGDGNLVWTDLPKSVQRNKKIEEILCSK